MQTSSSEPITGQQTHEPCGECAGTGRIRRFHVLAAILAAVGFGAVGYLIVERYVVHTDTLLSFRAIVLWGCVGIIGLYALLDREDCKACDGTGQVGGDEEDDDPTDGEWNTGVEEPQ